MAPVDPHSFADSTQPSTSHISLSLYFDFSSSIIHASALISLANPHTGPFFLDTRSLTINSILDLQSKTPIPFSLSENDPIKGRQLSVSLSNHSSFLVTYTTSPSSSALQWLNPLQTFNKAHPFVYTQCQAIHARSVFPCQDTPAVRICYSARLNIPDQLSAVMAARHVERRRPVNNEAEELGCGNSSWCAQGRVVEEFVMEQPVPPYLFAFAVGEIGNRDVGPRTRIYAEAVPELLDAAAIEFTGTEVVIRQGESLFGEYEWERFDLLVLPPSFPVGGMENPRMVFLTPTVIKGDASGAQVVAHELAHSWTGNLITNKTNEHFWLNEGFTTYAERRIVEVVQGEERAALNTGIGWRGLNEEVAERFRDNMEFTKLVNNQEGIDPDDVYSQVPYEKGFQFLLRIERQVGRPTFDEFLKKYIATFKFKSIDTKTFIDFLKANIPEIEKQIDLKLWTEGTGIPPDAYEPDSRVYNRIVSRASEFVDGRIPREDEVADWQGQEWELYLKNLPKSIEAPQFRVKGRTGMALLDGMRNLSLFDSTFL
ncbi:leucine aminopeptidase isoform X2 [Neltuma alba]|uniref:leucine aminopeptidase isoform X2 n=1 Tax=Neltuma alba TaxID=207710 RepID=UPI0010A4C2DD|nr:leucine aminopeptidase-like isoform X2 [Prosopis alba]XP_028799461.1 leucine aminopeptidase-like isoform X2 [Prosopis alba]